MTIYYMLEKNIFVHIVHTLLLQKKVSLKTIGKQTIKMMIHILLCKNEANSVLK